MAKKIVGIAAALALAAGLAACATATPYQPNIAGQKASGGYSELRVEPDRWRVTFAGNTMTSRETVEAYLLYRSAELTVQQGYDWFSAVDRSTMRSSYSYVDPTFYGGWGYGWGPSWRFHRHGWGGWGPYGGGPWGGYGGYDIRTYDKFEATAEIQMHRGAKPANDPRAFEAHAVIASLQPRIQYPEASKQAAATQPAQVK
jgi:hypothetical protein